MGVDPEEEREVGRPLGGELCPLSGVDPLSTVREERERSVNEGATENTYLAAGKVLT